MEFLVGRTIALLGVAMIVAIVARRLRLPYTVGLTLAGVGLAVARFDFGLELTPEVIFDVILPPLLFEAALNLDWRELWRDLAPVLAMSSVGVGLCAAVVGGGLVWGLGWPRAPAFAFGALIAATDPIAVIALLRETGTRGRLALIIESEALINDGAAALLFALVVGAMTSAAAPTPLDVVVRFVVIAVGGVIGGALVGLAAIFVAGRTDDPLVETALTAVAAYGSFLLADHFGASGVFACVTAGLVMGNFGELVEAEGGWKPALRGKTFVLAFWDFAAFVANSFVFLMIGVALAKAPARSYATLAVVVGLALLGRAAAVYPVALAFTRTRWRIPLREQHFLTWAGLRGAVALALALSLPMGTRYRDEILFGAFAVVAFSTLVQGLTAGLALRGLGLRK